MKKQINKETTIKRLVAKRTIKEDIGFWMDIYKDPAVLHQMYSAPTQTPKKLWEYLNCEQNAYIVWNGKKKIGGFFLSKVAPFIGTFSIVIHKDYRGKGFGREVMSLLETIAACEGYRTLRADVYIDNISSIKLLRKCKFRKFIWLEKNL